MKRMILPLVLLCLLCACAAADGALSRSFPVPCTASLALTEEEWLLDAESRARLTVMLWQDYCAQPEAAPCPAEGLSDSLIARPAEGGYLLCSITAGDGRLTVYFLPAAGEASYLWEQGDYDMDVKAAALTDRGMTVWINDPEAVKAIRGGVNTAAACTAAAFFVKR